VDSLSRAYTQLLANPSVATFVDLLTWWGVCALTGMVVILLMEMIVWMVNTALDRNDPSGNCCNSDMMYR